MYVLVKETRADGGKLVVPPFSDSSELPHSLNYITLTSVRNSDFLGHFVSAAHSEKVLLYDMLTFLWNMGVYSCDLGNLFKFLYMLRVDLERKK